MMNKVFLLHMILILASCKITARWKKYMSFSIWCTLFYIVPKNSNSMLLSPKAPERKQNGKSGRKRVPAQKQEKPPKKLTPVTENEFNSVSELIRGRCQLQDVNKVTIWRGFHWFCFLFDYLFTIIAFSHFRG